VSKKAWIIFASVCIVLLGGLVVIAGKNKVNVDGVDVSAILKASPQSGNIADHVFGKADSKVRIIEYGDFQCPGCGNAYPILKTVTEKYKNQVAFVFRNLPLTTLHPNARAAAGAAEAAGLQGKYWAMHDQLYANQSDWENLTTSQRLDTFANYAQALGLNVATFRKDYASERVNQKISFDGAVFAKTKLEKSTPTILVDGTQVQSDVWSNQTKMDAAVATALKAAGIALPNSAPKK
jgi:protein-disulfide isomerase